MPKIYELDPHIADLIAAGEVVERPASVVKELMENSIDAGAGIITVEIVAGGMTFIRVTDDGCGMAPDDAKTAFLRFATSKLRDAEGLEAINTLGFRGEALAAIAAVSRIELLTRDSGAGEGVSLKLEAGDIFDISPAGCPGGTTIIVRDLFFNTPARLKFMKSDRAESSAVASAALRCALAHPDVSVRFIRDGRIEYHTPGDGNVESCIYSLFGREFSSGLINADASDEIISVSGFVSAPCAARGNRSYQFFFVNGRPIRSITLQAALEQAYANKLTHGRFPSCALYITMRPHDVDVNVHPAKTEVKFASDKLVFDGVYYAALGALGRMQPETYPEPGVGSTGSGNQEVGSTGSGTDCQENRNSKVDSGGGYSGSRGYDPRYMQSNHNPQTGLSDQIKSGSSGFRSMQVDEYRSKYGPGESVGQTLIQGGNADQNLIRDDTFSQTHMGGDIRPSQEPLSQFPHGSFRVIGETLNVYIIVEYQDAVWFIDKHAAHERIHFDALCRQGYTPMSQSLITPVVCRQGHEDTAVLLENTGMLESLGFFIESYGEDSIAVRGIPAEIEAGDAEPVLSGICAELRRGGTSDLKRRDSIFDMIACKAAIKAGKASGIQELEALAARVISGEVSHCPHGRPVAYVITKTILDKGFKRI